MAVAGSSSEITASDSPKASRNTTGAAQAWLVRMNSSVAWMMASMAAFPGGCQVR